MHHGVERIRGDAVVVVLVALVVATHLRYLARVVHRSQVASAGRLAVKAQALSSVRVIHGSVHVHRVGVLLIESCLGSGLVVDLLLIHHAHASQLRHGVRPSHRAQVSLFLKLLLQGVELVGSLGTELVVDVRLVV